MGGGTSKAKKRKEEEERKSKEAEEAQKREAEQKRENEARVEREKKAAEETAQLAEKRRQETEILERQLRSSEAEVQTIESEFVEEIQTSPTADKSTAEEDEQKLQSLELQRRAEELEQLADALKHKEEELRSRENQWRFKLENMEKDQLARDSDRDVQFQASFAALVDGSFRSPREDTVKRKPLFFHTVPVQNLSHDERYGTLRAIPLLEPSRPPGWSIAPVSLQGNLSKRYMRVFVCSSLDGADDHDHLHNQVYPRLISEAHRRGVVLHFVDLREGLYRAAATIADAVAAAQPLTAATAVVAAAEAEARLIVHVLREVDRCRPFFVGLLGDSYHRAVGRDVCEILSAAGHAWVLEEGLHQASVAEIVCRYALFSAARRPLPPLAAAPARFYLQVGDDGAAGRAAPAGLTPWGPGTVGAALAAAGDLGLELAAPAGEAEVSNWRKSVESQASSRGALGALEAALASSGLPVAVCRGAAGVARQVYGDWQGLLDRLFPFPSDGTAASDSDSTRDSPPASPSLMPLAAKAGGGGGAAAAWTAGWKPACGEGWWADEEPGLEVRAGRAFQEWCAASGLPPPRGVCDALDRYVDAPGRLPG